MQCIIRWHTIQMTISLELRFPRCHVQYCERAPEVLNTNLDSCLPAYDGRRSLYTNDELSFNTKEFEVTLPDNKPGPSEQRRETKFKMTIKHAADAHGRDLLGHTGAGARHCAARHRAQQMEQHGGCSFFSRTIKEPIKLGQGVEGWSEFYHCIRHTQRGLSLNIDMSLTALVRAVLLTDFIGEVLNRRDIIRDILIMLRLGPQGLRVEVTHQGEVQRNYHIAGLTKKSGRD